MRDDGVIALCLQWRGEGDDWYDLPLMVSSTVGYQGIPTNEENAAPSTDLAKLITSAILLDPMSRARLLETSSNIAQAHASAAAGGDTAAPSAEDDIDLHFVAFVKSAENNLWELDGRRKGPLNRGKLGDEEDALTDKALDLGVRRFLKREEEGQGGELRFSLVALAPSMD